MANAQNYIIAGKCLVERMWQPSQTKQLISDYTHLILNMRMQFSGLLINKPVSNTVKKNVYM